MAKRESIVRYSAKELAARRQRGQARFDWARAVAMTEEEIEADIASDPDEAGMVVDWDNVSVELPKRKADLHMRIDRDVPISSARTDAVTRAASMRCCVPMSSRLGTNDQRGRSIKQASP